MIKFKVYYSKRASMARLITSFHMLAREGIIDLELIYNYDNFRKIPGTEVVEAEAEGKCIAFDMGNRWILCHPGTIKYLDRIDTYFARDYSEKESTVTPIVFLDNQKVNPYGFNYYSSYYGNPVLKPTGGSELFKYYLQYLCGYSRCFEPNYIEGYPDKKEKGLSILFMARLWDPSSIQLDPSLPKEVNQYRQYMMDEWSSINRTRISVMRILKREFGSAFFGGMEESALSAKVCPDLILPKRCIRKKTYLDRMKRSDICISTVGLHKSIGWKMGEYVAGARAIVSEPLEYVLPGNFTEGKNYLAFTSPEACCEQVISLYHNPDKVFEMKQENHKYYREYLEPKRQLLNALKTAGFSFSQ